MTLNDLGYVIGYGLGGFIALAFYGVMFAFIAGAIGRIIKGKR